MPEFEAELEKMDRLVEEGVQVGPPIGSQDWYYTIWGGMYATPRMGAFAPQIHP